MPPENQFDEEALTHAINGAFYYVYNRLRYGFVENVYAAALEHVLLRTGHKVAREVAVPVWFENRIIAYQRLDMLVDNRVIVEMKATEHLPEHAPRQLLSYLRATRLSVGLLLHFGKKPSHRRLFWRQ